MSFLEAMRQEMVGQRGVEASLAEGLGVFAGYAQDERLRGALPEARAKSQTQRGRLDTILQSMSWKPDGEGSKILDGLQWQARETLADALPSPATDALIVGTVQKVLHLEIATYGTLRALALRMGEEGVAYLLGRNLDEDKATDQALTEIAETGINQAAAASVTEDRTRGWSTQA